MKKSKKLYKDDSNKKVFGVLAGFSKYIGGEITLVRLCYVLLTIRFPILIIFYFLSDLIIPDQESNHESN